jgi:LPS-assembly lipoprotein
MIYKCRWLGKYKNFKKYFFIFCIGFHSIFMMGCGFHPQGQVQFAKPLHRLYLQTSDPYGYLARHLQEFLKISNIQLVSSKEEADAILSILRDESSQTFLSVSSTQQTRQYNLIVIVEFEISDSKGRVLVNRQTLVETKPITFQSNQMLGSSNEATLYYQQMRRTLAYAIMNRIASKEVTHMIMDKSSPSTYRDIHS